MPPGLTSQGPLSPPRVFYTSKLEVKSFQLGLRLPPTGGGLLMKGLIKLAHIKKSYSFVCYTSVFQLTSYTMPKSK